MGLFGDLFDFDLDGKMSTMENAAGFSIFSDIMDEDEANKKRVDLKSSGLDEDDLELMDKDEREEALEDAGLDSDDFDFD